jgi:hypothetical protein
MTRPISPRVFDPHCQQLRIEQRQARAKLASCTPEARCSDIKSILSFARPGRISRAQFPG